MNARLSWCTVCVSATLCLIAVNTGCTDGTDLGFVLGIGPDSGSLSSRTVLTSTSLSGSIAAAQDTPEFESAEDVFVGLAVTPDNVTGEVLSLLFATDGQEDEGVVIFGNERPDIAPADSDLIDFDFSDIDPDPIEATIQLQPGFVGGTSSLMVLLFGYMDMHFTLYNTEYIVRIAFAEIDDMERGDKLLYNESTGNFEWYDLDTAAFTTTRPNNPAVIEEIRDFTDPIRPELVFYPVNANVIDPISVDAAELTAASTMSVVLDFVMTDIIVLVGETDPSAVSVEELITSFDLAQNVEDPAAPFGGGFGDSGFLVGAEVELN